jgi:hypothetical protein
MVSPNGEARRISLGVQYEKPPNRLGGPDKEAIPLPFYVRVTLALPRIIYVPRGYVLAALVVHDVVRSLIV